MNQRTVFITGATGFIGRHVVDEFISHGWKVLALRHRRLSSHLSEYAAAGKLTIVHSDAASPELAEALGDMKLDAVIHVAGLASDTGSHEAFRRANFQTVQNVGQLAMDAGARFVHISSTDVYGLRDFEEEAEDQMPLSNNCRNPYPEFKILAEEWIRINLPSDRCVILRPAAVWGRDDTTLTLRFASFLRSSPFIVHFGRWRGRNRWPLAHVRNVAMAAYEAAVQPSAAGQAINILDSEHTTIDEFYELIATIFHPERRYRRLFLPLAIGWLFGAFVSGLTNLLRLNQPFTDPTLYAVYSLSCNLNFSNEKFLELLKCGKISPVTREQGISELRESYLAI